MSVGWTNPERRERRVPAAIHDLMLTFVEIRNKKPKHQLEGAEYWAVTASGYWGLPRLPL